MIPGMKFTLRLVAMLLLCVSPAYAGNPGDKCDPATSIDYSARIVEADGNVSVRTPDGRLAPGIAGMKIPAGATIKTDAHGAAVLALEDGTSARDSRAGLGAASRLSITGGLRCTDMRPKFDESRWTAGRIALELVAGEVELEIARQVSHSFALEITTPNGVAEMRRASQHRMAARIQVTGLESRKLVPLLEHHQVQQHFPLQLRDRSLDSLSSTERQALLVHATNAAVSLGLVDLDQTGIFDHPTMQSTLASMSGGRRYAELDQAERNRFAPALAGMALTMGLLDPEKIQIYDQPDEFTRIEVDAGMLRVYNRHRGRKRAETIEVGAGMGAVVAGREVPTIVGD